MSQVEVGTYVRKRRVGVGQHMIHFLERSQLPYSPAVWTWACSLIFLILNVLT